jgi:Cdc6-like AAA superfamily ATPase
MNKFDDNALVQHFHEAKPSTPSCVVCGIDVEPTLVPGLGWFAPSVHPGCAKELRSKPERSKAKVSFEEIIDLLVFRDIILANEASDLRQHVEHGLQLNQRWLKLLGPFKTTDKKRWGFMFGKPGTGKTTQAILFMATWLHLRAKENEDWRSCRVVYTTEPRMLRRLSSFADQLEKYSEADLLVIDEAGDTAPTHAKVTNFAEIISERHRNKKTTLFLSNHSLSKLMKQSEFYNPRISTRLLDLIGELGDLIEANIVYRNRGL